MATNPLPDPQKLQISDLDLDAENPRLPEELRDARQADILRHIQAHYDLLRIANSISRNGFYPSEPLIAVQKGKRYIVVEGNRRLAAIRTLSEIPQKLQHRDRWLALAVSDKIPKLVPVMVADDRSAVAAIIGYRHIAGIEQWEPWAKARFIGRLIDDERRTFDDVSEIVSENVADVIAAYRNYRILVDARKKGVKTDGAEDAYGVFSRAMTSAPLRKFVGVGAGIDVRPRRAVLPAAKVDEVKELFEWMFGPKAVIGESRDISKLGRVVDSDEGLKVLRRTGDLDEADFASGGQLDRLKKRLLLAKSNLQKASEDIRKYSKNAEVRELLQDCSKALAELHGEKA